MAFGLLTGTSGIQADFLSRLEALRRALPNNLGAQIGIASGYRSPQRQAQLFANAVRKYGSEGAARKWVAPPGRSRHNLGLAVDLSYASPAAMRAAHQYAAQFGLTFPMSYENWHIEPIGARGGKISSAVASAADTAPASAPAPASSVSDLLAGATVGSGTSGAPSLGGISSGGGGGGGGGGGLKGDFSAPSFSLPVTPVSEGMAAGATLPANQVDIQLSPLASLFTLPMIGQAGAEPDTLAQPGSVPGQAKSLRRPVMTG